MSDIVSAYTSFNAPIIQYLSNFAKCPSWSVRPTNWNIQSDFALNQHNTNQSNPCGAVFSNANLTFLPKVMLTYGQFTPAIAFAPNALNNPLSQQSITQLPYLFTASNTPIAFPYDLEIANISTYDAQTMNPLITNTTYTFSALVNNYSISSGNLAFEGNKFQIYRRSVQLHQPIGDSVQPDTHLFRARLLSSGEQLL